MRGRVTAGRCIRAHLGRSSLGRIPSTQETDVTLTSALENRRECIAPLPEAETPRLHVETAVVEDAYLSLGAALPGVRLHYAVKANPAPAVLSRLHRLGCGWDVASPGEIRDVLAA